MTDALIASLMPGGPLHPLAAYPQFMLYKLMPGQDGKMIKLPMSPHTGVAPASVTDPANFCDAATALSALPLYGDGHGVAFVFTERDPFWFLDIDNCLDAATGQWKPEALQVLAMAPGAAIEVSSSGRGLHAFFTGPASGPGRRGPDGLELYSQERFVALTGNCNPQGSAAAQVDPAPLLARYFPTRSDRTKATEWTSEPVPEWGGPTDDDVLIERMLASKLSMNNAMGRTPTPRQLWERDVDVLASFYPSETGKEFNESSADLALAKALAWWTGKDCERIQRLMERSGLARDKWELHSTYMESTILTACGGDGGVYPKPELKRAAEWTTESQERFPTGVTPVDAVTGLTMNPESRFAQAWGAADLAQVLPTLVWRLGANCEAVLEAVLLRKHFEDTPELRGLIADACARCDRFASGPAGPAESIGRDAQVRSEPMLMKADAQVSHFAGCTYVRCLNKILTPSGDLYDKAAFDAVMGPFHFVMGQEKVVKPSKSAWEAFLFSQFLKHPHADLLVFRPALRPGELIQVEGRVGVNSFVPVPVARVPGDVAPFLDHVARLLPEQADREILLAYLAAVVQYPGVKFRWAPVLQGWEGNGKGVFETVLRGALGMRYVHMAQANDIENKFNAWLVGKLLIIVNEVNTSGRVDVIDVLKPMIADPVLGIQGKGEEQASAEVCANFFFTTNRKGAMGKAAEGRRYAIFHTAQQSKADLARDGLTGAYFVRLNRWLAGGGQAALNHWLAEYPIPEHLNPAGTCQVAPETTSYQAAVAEGLGSVEQEVLEAIESERVGFRGGFVSSYHLSQLIHGLRKDNQVGPAKRRELMQGLGFDWHPSLNRGRSTVVLPSDGSNKSILFIRKGSPLEKLQTGREIADQYEKLQTGGNFLKVVN